MAFWVLTQILIIILCILCYCGGKMPEIILTILHQIHPRYCLSTLPWFSTQHETTGLENGCRELLTIFYERCQDSPLISLRHRSQEVKNIHLLSRLTVPWSSHLSFTSYIKKIQETAKLNCVNSYVIFPRCANCEVIGLCLDPETEGGERAETARDPIMPG